MGNLVWTPYFVLMRFPLNDELDLFWKMILLFENDLESPLIFVLFLKGKQNKKENPKCNSLFGKGSLWKTGSGSGVRLLIGKVR